MSESFEALLNEVTESIPLRTGDIIKGTVVSITQDFVVLFVGLKSDAYVSVDQFKNANGEVEINVGDKVDVLLEHVENGFGETRVSREKARRAESWINLETSHNNDEIVVGRIVERVKGGFTVEVHNVKAFLPGSLVDVRPVRDSSYLEGKELEFKIVKIDRKRNNIVVSRRAVVESENGEERQALIESLNEGAELKGVVKNLTDYGAFVDLGGIDGLLHVTDMAWKRIKHPNELLNVGDEIDVVVLKFDREKNRVSLGMKQLRNDPWKDVTSRFPVGSQLEGKVTNLTDYGCFVEIEDGIEGLVHMSEMDWTNKNIHPSKVVQTGLEVKVKVLEIDEDRRRISLGIKQCAENPWDTFTQSHSVGDKISGTVKSITDFGVFIGLDGNIDGLVHLSDLSWAEPGEKIIRDYKKGLSVEAVILAMDPEKERISLGVKQLESNPLGEFTKNHNRGDVIEGKVVAVDTNKLIVELQENVSGVLKNAELERKDIDDPSATFEVDELLNVKIDRIDTKSGYIELLFEDGTLTTKPRADKIAKAAPQATLGGLIQEHLQQGSEK